MTQPSPEHREEAREMPPCPFCGEQLTMTTGRSAAINAREFYNPCCEYCDYVFQVGFYNIEDAIKACSTRALSSRDREIRDVLEGLATHQIGSRRPCWCPPDYESEPHTPTCLAARALWERVQVVKEGNDGD